MLDQVFLSSLQLHFGKSLQEGLFHTEMNIGLEIPEYFLEPGLERTWGLIARVDLQAPPCSGTPLAQQVLLRIDLKECLGLFWEVAVASSWLHDLPRGLCLKSRNVDVDNAYPKVKRSVFSLLQIKSTK